MTAAYRFGLFEMQPDQRRLLIDGDPVALGSRAFDVLLALAERAGQLVTKIELLELVWPGVIVEENNLQVQISTLRKVLGPHAIATIPGRGYRLALAPDDASTEAARFESAPPATLAGSAALPDAPTESPALYGRAEDIAALSDLIRHHALVTVVGSAGIGKTRLAQAVVHELRNEFADGVVLVELAPLADPALVAVTVARALGLMVGDVRTAVDLAAQALAGRRLLLVFDNCEHLLASVDHMLAALRKGAPSVHIVATSQELLRHPDEHVYRLGTLALPDEATVSSAREAGAVELFVARVQAVRPRFLLSDENVGAVVEICRRLDGLPLAIELAAARAPLLGVEGVRERLGERFRLLTAGSRLALLGNQTLRGAWSGVTACSRSRSRQCSTSSACLPAASALNRRKSWPPMTDGRVGGARSPGRAGRQVAGERGRWHYRAVRDAGDDSSVRTRASRRPWCHLAGDTPACGGDAGDF